MAKVTFEFTRTAAKTTNVKGQIVEGLNIAISVTEMSPECESGPDDAIAMILASQRDTIIQAASQELLKALKDGGAEDVQSIYHCGGNKH